MLDTLASECRPPPSRRVFWRVEMFQTPPKRGALVLKAFQAVRGTEQSCWASEFTGCVDHKDGKWEGGFRR